MPDETQEKIQKEYDSALQELECLEKEKEQVVANYIHELEQEKIEELRSSLGATSVENNS